VLFLLTVVVRSGYVTNYKSVLGAGAVCKNRDKQLTFIIRVAKEF